ncbi:MAG: hypothetical protein AMXMBFR48_27150 [Ignavibacteriales bacterium]
MNREPLTNDWHINSGDYISKNENHDDLYARITKAEKRRRQIAYAGYGVFVVFLLVKALKFASVMVM